MTEIAFYHNTADKVATACRLAADLYAAGRRVVLYARDDRIAAAADRLLWLQPATSFIPHVRAGSPLAAETPIVIGDAGDALPHADVLVNLGADTPPGFSRFERLVEVVGTDEADRVPARSRYKFYRDRGYPLTTSDCNAP